MIQRSRKIPVRGPKSHAFSVWVLLSLFLFVGFTITLILLDVAYVNREAFYEALHSKEIWASAKLSVVTSVTTVIIAMIFAIPMGYALSRYRFPGHTFVDTIVDIPIIFPPLIIGLSLLIFFQTGFVVLSYFALDAKMHYDLSTGEYQVAYDRYEEAKISGSVQEIAAAQADARAKFDIKEDNRTDMYTYAISAGALWFLNVLDAVVFGGAGEEPDRFEFDTSLRSSTVRTGLRFNF